MTISNCTVKTCSTCLLPKDLSEFNKHKRNKDGLQYICKSCDLLAAKIYARTKNGVATTIYRDQKTSSKRRNHDIPDYTKSVFSNWLFSQSEFHRLYDLWVASGYLKMKKPSCDRKNDYAPYTLDNIQLMTWQENFNKGHTDRKNGTNNKGSKSVIQMDLLGNLIKHYHSARHANRVLGIDQSSIGRCCNGKAETSGGFKWAFADEKGLI